MAEIVDTIRTQADQLLNLLGFSEGVEIEEQDGIYHIQINTQDTGILIGYHGQTLSALQTILSHMLFKKTGNWLKISLNVSDYWQNREQQLKAMATHAAEEAIQSQKSFSLPYLSSRERRYIHVLLQDKPDIKTESVGEGEQRRLVVFPA